MCKLVRRAYGTRVTFEAVYPALKRRAIVSGPSGTLLDPSPSGTSGTLPSTTRFRSRQTDLKRGDALACGRDMRRGRGLRLAAGAVVGDVLLEGIEFVA